MPPADATTEAAEAAPAAPAASSEAAGAPAATGVADEDLDVFGVNVNDVNGTGEPPPRCSLKTCLIERLRSFKGENFTTVLLSCDLKQTQMTLKVTEVPRLCSLFALEDWVLLMLRVEFHLMAHAFKKDITSHKNQVEM